MSFTGRCCGRDRRRAGGSMVANIFLRLPALLAISAVGITDFLGRYLYETSNIIHGETNYIRCDRRLYVSLYSILCQPAQHSGLRQPRQSTFPSSALLMQGFILLPSVLVTR